ncbi:Muskelin 1, intracellular mediator containing kelch motif, partial [Entophlyctis sp. JEL0112]
MLTKSRSNIKSLEGVDAFIADFNAAYEKKHKAFEDNFWATKMNLKGCSSDELTRTKNELDAFLGDENALSMVQELLRLPDLNDEDKKTLRIFERTFKCYIITDPEGVKMRQELNHLEAKLAENRRAMKLAAEGFGKRTLFPILEKLVERSKNIRDKALSTLAKEKGELALKPWNMGYFMSGDLSALQDPYFPFETAVNVWARSFAALGIEYSGATMTLDLCDRPGKYSNGFCHWPQPAWISQTRGWIPSQANFTSLATPGQIGSGRTALVTLMHEGGHAAHFANVKQPSPLFSQERAPTSIPYAENQSMFLDSLVQDAAWLGRYARSNTGEVIPWELIEKEIRSLHAYKVFALTSMLVVPIFERRLYEMPDDKLTAASMIQLADEVELEVQGVLSGRPIITVHQTRQHFLKKYGRIVDNPQVGEDLKTVYWEPGNSRMFLDLVQEMTGKPLSGDAWIDMLEEDVENVVRREKVAYEEAIKSGPKYGPKDSVDLNMRVVLVHGDEVIADSEKLEGGLSQACTEFEKWIGNFLEDKPSNTPMSSETDDHSADMIVDSEQPLARPLGPKSSSTNYAAISSNFDVPNYNIPQSKQAHDTKKFPTQTPVSQKLNYGVFAWSSHSAGYHPRHVLVNKPTDQSSRWSSGSNNQVQYLTLKLDKIAVVQTITFGKYHKVHVCNLKEFKVYGGLTLNNMTELLHSGLRNDSEPETFSLKHKVNDVVFPCQYIKIAPNLAWGPNFNFSIWYVELWGSGQPEYVDKVYRNFVTYRENEVVRLCLKHFRQRNYLDAFECLQNRTQLELEDPLLTSLHQSLVITGDFEASEKIIETAYSRNLFVEYVRDTCYKPEWRFIPNESHSEKPCMRGGHQMCIDSEEGNIYLFGGWDGQKDLSDFWSFNYGYTPVEFLSPPPLFNGLFSNGGPGPRSCHKICIDPSTKSIFTMGRYVDPDNRPNVNLDGDFWRYDITGDRWIKISSSTALDGGPQLIFDHQMIIDSQTQTLYVFVQPTSAIQLKSRIGHSMLFNPITRELYIFAGQRNKDYLSDFYIYEIDTDIVHEVSRDYSKQGGPDAGFTQRATIDPEIGEFYVLSGLQKERNTTHESVKNSFWCYSIKRGKWTRVYHNENTGAEYWAKMKDKEPCPRFAHQLVYDHVRKCQYLFGGNPGDSTNLNLRLDDLWELRLIRPSAEAILRRAKFRIRRQQFREMCLTDSTGARALEFLQTKVHAVIDHSDEVESKQFRNLTQFLFKWSRPFAGSALEFENFGNVSNQDSPSAGATDE